MDSVRPKPKTRPVTPAPLAQPSKPPLPPRVPAAESPRKEPAQQTPSFPRVKPLTNTTPHPRMKNILFFVFGSIFLVGVILGAALLWQGISVGNSLQITGSTKEAPTLGKKLESLRQVFLSTENVPLKGEERGRINILLLGKASEDAPGKDLTDTLMLASIHTKEKKVALISLPRDLYIELPSYQFGGKINTLYQFGIYNELGTKPLAEAINIITDQEVDYFFVIDFDGFEEVIDALGGITVDVPKDFYDPRYPGKNYSYETFELKKGWQKLDGATALKYVRERHDDPEGDFGRAKRQQQVLEAVRNKAMSPGTYFNFLRVVKLFESVENNVQTDISVEEMKSFYTLSKSLDTRNITNRVIDAWKEESLLRVSHQILGGTRAFTLVPRTGNWEETQSLAQNIFSLDALALRKKTIKQENASVLILDNGETLQSAQKLARYLEREHGLATEVLYQKTLVGNTSPAILVSRGGLAKPYTFDELLEKLPLQKEETLPALPPNAPQTDFVLVMDQNLATAFQSGDELFSPELENASPLENISQ